MEEARKQPLGPKGKNVEKLAQNIQEAFLNNARKEKTFLTVYLISGVKLSGRIRSFDKYSVILESNSQEQLIFKHAISTVVVARPAHVSTGGAQMVAGAGAGGSGQPGMPAGATEHHEG
jgi:host factor-I protein